MTATERIAAARERLNDLTPLVGDCGRRCQGACCHADEDGKGGMLLFPGEEAFYDPCPAWARLTPSEEFEGQFLFTCQGRCERALRPLSCRIFPLTPRVRKGEPRVELDVRAWPVCPLMEYGMEGLSAEFTRAVQEIARDLWEDARCRAYLEALSERLAEYERF